MYNIFSLGQRTFGIGTGFSFGCKSKLFSSSSFKLEEFGSISASSCKLSSKSWSGFSFSDINWSLNFNDCLRSSLVFLLSSGSSYTGSRRASPSLSLLEFS